MDDTIFETFLDFSGIMACVNPLADELFIQCICDIKTFLAY